MNGTVMKTCALGALAAGLAACAAPEPAVPTFALENAGFETAPDPQRPCALGWYCTMHANPQAFRFFHEERAPAGGKRSFCIEPLTNEPWALVTQGIHKPSFAGTTVRFSIAVRVEGAAGGAGPWLLIQVPQARNIHQQKLVTGTQGWQRITLQVDVPANAQIIEFGGTLEGGGRACFDDARVELVAGSKNPV